MTLADLRRHAQDTARAEKWDELAAMEAQLRADAEQWVTEWAPLCAIATRMIGRGDDARDLLGEAIAGGFFQPELYEPEMSTAFSADADWPDLRAAMAANTPPAPITLLEWPAVTPTAPYTLFRLPEEREALLRERIPTPQPTAWTTAQALLAWVTARWTHSNEHVDPDAVDILDRVDAGARFACVEYSTVLSQALNAVGIPARRVAVRTATYHAGYGAGHVISEAWIDDLGRWVALDGQNGLYWADPDGTPLGLLELQQRHRAGPRAKAVFLGAHLPDYALDLWWSYLGSVSTNTVSWGVPGFVPFFQGRPMTTGLLLVAPADAYPDFAQLGTTMVAVNDAVALLPIPAHPYATGYRIIDGATCTDFGLDQPWPLAADTAGEHRVQVATLTCYGALQPSTLRYTVAG